MVACVTPPPTHGARQKKRHEKHDKHRTKKTKGFAINSLSTRPCYLTRACPEQKKKHTHKKKTRRRRGKTTKYTKPNTRRTEGEGRKARSGNPGIGIGLGVDSPRAWLWAPTCLCVRLSPRRSTRADSQNLLQKQRQSRPMCILDAGKTKRTGRLSIYSYSAAHGVG